MEWILPTPTPYLLVELVQIVEVSSSEEDPEEDLGEEPEEVQPEPTGEISDMPAMDGDPIIELDFPEEFIPVPEVESTEESGPDWLVESDDSSGGDSHDEVAPAVQTPPPIAAVDSSQTSSKFAVVPDIDLLGSPHDTDGLSTSDST